MRRIVALLTLSLAALLAPAAQAQSASRLDDILARGVLRVGTTGDYKPFSYRPAKDAEFVGLDIELAGELARTMGVKLQLVPTSWPTLMKDFGDDRFDLAIGGVSVTLERQKKGVFSIPTCAMARRRSRAARTRRSTRRYSRSISPVCAWS